MSIRCFFGRHRPNLTTIVGRDDGFTALCDDCGMPLSRKEHGRWTTPEPLASRANRAA
jgi:hypothetical protein